MLSFQLSRARAAGRTGQLLQIGAKRLRLQAKSAVGWDGWRSL
jgi:hypothetical protein